MSELKYNLGQNKDNSPTNLNELNLLVGIKRVHSETCVIWCYMIQYYLLIAE